MRPFLQRLQLVQEAFYKGESSNCTSGILVLTTLPCLSVSLSMNIDTLSKAFKMCGTNDSLRLRWENDADKEAFVCENSEDDRIADFELILAFHLANCITLSHR